MAICEAPEHKAAAVAGVDDAVLERPRTEQLQQISSTKGLASQGMRNGAAKPPYADYADRLHRVSLCLVKAVQYSWKRIFVVKELEREFEGLGGSESANLRS